MMKPIVAAVALLATVSTAKSVELHKRQSSNEVTSGACKDVLFIFARGSTEPGNMVYMIIFTTVSLHSANI